MMDVSHAPLDEKGVGFNYFCQEVPKIIHQICFVAETEEQEKKTKEWENYADKFNYGYKKWNAKDWKYFLSMIPPHRVSFIRSLLKENHLPEAASVIRYEILRRLGGIYIDINYSPPRDEKGDWIDLGILLNFKGLTVMTEKLGRNIKEGALFVSADFIMTPSFHPVITAACQQVEANSKKWLSNKGEYDHSWCMGSFFLNKILWGTFNVVPYFYLKEYKMHGLDNDFKKEENKKEKGI